MLSNLSKPISYMLVFTGIMTAASLLGMLYVPIIDSPTPTLVMVSQWVSTASVYVTIANGCAVGAWVTSKWWSNR